MRCLWQYQPLDRWGFSLLWYGCDLPPDAQGRLWEKTALRRMIQDGIHHDHTSNNVKYCIFKYVWGKNMRKKSVVKSGNRKYCACRNLASSVSFRPPPKGRGAKKRAARRKTLPASATLKTLGRYTMMTIPVNLWLRGWKSSLVPFFLTQTRTGIQSNFVMRKMPLVRAQSVLMRLFRLLLLAWRPPPPLSLGHERLQNTGSDVCRIKWKKIDTMLSRETWWILQAAMAPGSPSRSLPGALRGCGVILSECPIFWHLTQSLSL